MTLSAAIGHGFHYLRDRAASDQLADGPEPVLRQRSQCRRGLGCAARHAGTPDRANIAADVDIIHARHALAPFVDAVRTVPAGVLAGAIDHAAERVVFEDSFKLGAAAEVETNFVSVGRVFEVAAETGVKIVALLPDGSSPPPDVEPIVAALIAEALAAGRIVVVPERSVLIDDAPRSGWWEIDPETGQSFDRLDNGRGSSLGEYAEILHWMYTAGVCAVGLGMAVAGIIGWISGEAGLAGAAAGAGMCIAAAAVVQGRAFPHGILGSTCSGGGNDDELCVAAC